ncbi:kinase-like domain-containing protein [Lineolata rhizophorae]|uniref:Kinase-like domain-containing protein n=1 Tax=Lineolata rhizophorae TaxID=578093 RepID=A0A6A6NPE2_9PEZI|nr:kinase-like domain-containing protein [Lineolata rhizophorae]
MTQPLPKPQPETASGRDDDLGGWHSADEDDYDHRLSGEVAHHHRRCSESRMEEFDPDTGEPLDRKREQDHPPFRKGEMRHPFLQSTVDELAKDQHMGDYDRISSLTSGTTASPIMEEVRTPLEPTSEYMLSPVAATSPMDFPSQPTPWSERRTGSQRSRSYRSEKSGGGSMRRASRRSTRSGTNTSVSPASAFLSQWSKEEAAAPEPDDEGQEIGDHSEYIIGRQIGFGGFSVVKEVLTIEDNVKVQRAVKIVRKVVSGKTERENEKIQAEFEHEVSIWRFLKHRYILPLIAVYDSPFATFCITQLNVGGTLFDLVRKNRKESKRGLPAPLARRYTYQLASAIRYLHEDVRVVHRDIKLENCLLDMSGPSAATEGGNVLLCDFGMADFITNEHRQEESPEPYVQLAQEQVDLHSRPPLSTLHHQPASPELALHNANIGPSRTSTSVLPGGSLQYAAPELIDAPVALYSPAVDMWAYGVVCYALLAGELPFQHPFEPRLVMMILAGEWNEEALEKAPAVVGFSYDPIELVRGCLEMDPEKRLTVGGVLESKWLAGCKELYEPEEAWT